MVNGKWKMWSDGRWEMGDGRWKCPDLHISHLPSTIFHLFPVLLLVILPSCAKVAVEGGDKPIHIVMDVNIRVDRELEQFFAFEEQYQAPTTQAAMQTAPTTLPTSTPVDDLRPSDPSNPHLRKELQP